MQCNQALVAPFLVLVARVCISMERSPELAINYFVETCLAIDSFSGEQRGVLDCFSVPASLLSEYEDLNL
jgi:hypothetical protein